MAAPKNLDANDIMTNHLHDYIDESLAPAYHESSQTANIEPQQQTYITVNESLDYINKKLTTFVMPTAYDGSDTIKNSLHKVIQTLKDEINKKYFDEIPAHVQDIGNRLLESIYFHYKYAQRGSMKITNLLQRILINLLNISHDEVATALASHNSLSKQLLSKKSLLTLIRDNLIEACFWQAAGPEAHVSLRLLDAKLYMTQPENRFVRRQIVAMHQCGQQQKLLELTQKISAIRINVNLSDYQRHQAIIQLLREYQSQDIGKFATKLDSLLIEAERHVNDYFDVTMARC